MKKENMKKILIIEDDIWISKSLKLYLENSNYKTDVHSTWKWAIEKIKEYKPDLIILDINLPEKNWMIICKELRTFSQAGVIMLTARDNEYDRISWLEIWADDYIAKPFSPRELLVRIKIILKRISSNNENKHLLTFWNIKLDTDKKTLEVNWKNVSLTKNEYDILEKILKEDWNLVSRETIMTEIIWYEKYVFDRTIDTHIKNLRKKLWNKEIILTIRWKWYRLNK